MNKWQAIDTFWNSFGIPAYDENSVTSDMSFPYITYSSEVGSLNGVIYLSASIWYKSASWKNISLKADEIAEYIGQSRVIKLDNGYWWITKGQPFAQRMGDSSNDMIRRIYLNLTVEFLTAD